MPEQVVFLCGARDFHAMDWYKSARELMPEKDVFILTDLIAGEGYKKLVVEEDKVFNLLIIDSILFKKQSHFGHIWRNAVKLIVFPIQVYLIKRFAEKYPGAIYHAHSMYYLTLAWAAGITYVGTPQGSDILIKPFKSRLYKYFTIKSLKKAKAVTVDSLKMRELVFKLAGVEAHVIQNGIDLNSMKDYISHNTANPLNRKTLLSIRGLAPLYRITDIVKARNSSLKLSNASLTIIYPFYENEYMKDVHILLNSSDKDLGRVDRATLYKLLSEARLAVSIPQSDSSPRSVYEAIFCGCAVAVTHHPYYDTLPQCMKSRVCLVDLNQEDWLEKAFESSEKIVAESFSPSEEALQMFDQRRSFQIIKNLLFNN